jgi:hypothetical protein
MIQLNMKNIAKNIANSILLSYLISFILILIFSETNTLSINIIGSLVFSFGGLFIVGAVAHILSL